MASLDSLPGDQRAVLQLVLGRGRSYDEIARLLSINPTAVRERAVAALDALGPQTKVDPEHRASISDYLLGQLPEAEIDGVRARLAGSASERAWARVISSELAPLASGPLPDIPVEADPVDAAAEPTPSAPPPPPSLPPVLPPAVTPGPGDTQGAGGAPDAGDGGAGDAEQAPEPPSRRRGRRGRREKTAAEAVAAATGSVVPEVDAGAGEARSSRLGGMILIGVSVAVVAIILIVVLSSGGSSKKPQPVASTPTTASTASATTTPTTSSTAKVIAQINLKPTAAGSKAAGIAEVLNEGSTNGIAIVAQNVTPNTTHPPNAYAVWLYNSPTDAHILGFVNPAVGATGRLSTAGGLPANASHYKQLIVTVETSASPKTPGQIILSGPLAGA
jgi:hypothetical protein